jgi:peptide-methionine (S)-S-oxide reductase
MKIDPTAEQGSKIRMGATRYRRSVFLRTMAVALVGCISGMALPAAGLSAAAAATTGKETATLAAGCFWSMEAIFKQLKGVEKVVPGYAGGKVANPSYEQVAGGNTGHAETIQITYDPNVISYHDLLQVMLTSRNPTTVNQQGPDEGPEYRSVIFYENPGQKTVAQQTIREINASHIWKRPIVTAVTPFTNFYPAESYHVDYYAHHPDQPYCKYVIAPEIVAFRARFHSKLKN